MPENETANESRKPLKIISKPGIKSTNIKKIFKRIGVSEVTKNFPLLFIIAEPKDPKEIKIIYGNVNLE